MPSPIFFNLATWHLIHQSYSRRSLHDAGDLWQAYANRVLHTRLMRVLQAREGHRILAEVETAKIACSNAGGAAPLDLDCIERGLAATLTPQGLDEALQDRLALIVDCARACVGTAGIQQPDVVYLTGGSSALAPLGAAFEVAFPGSDTVTGDRFGSVAAGLATLGARQDLVCA